MKSVMHEASTIAKAVEQAWHKAGEPKEFTIKVLEHPQKNFLGLTTHPAKIALFFDMPAAPKVGPQNNSPKPKAQPQPQVQAKKAPKVPDVVKEVELRPAPKVPAVAAAAPRTRDFKPLWNDEMTEFVKCWLTETLAAMNLSDVNFALEPSDFYLRITFKKAVLSDIGQEKKLFASFATLILETLKKTYKTGLRGHKIVLMHAPEHDVSPRR